MSKSYFIFLGLLLILSLSQESFSQPGLEWSRYHNNGSGFSEQANSLCIDNHNNVYVAGAGSSNVYKILGYNPAGDLISSAYRGSGPAYKILYSGNDKFFISGASGLLKLTQAGVLSEMDLNNIAAMELGEDNSINITYAYHSVYFNKYSPEGDLIWAKTYGSSPYSYSMYNLFNGAGEHTILLGQYTMIIIGILSTGPVHLTYNSEGNMISNTTFPQGIVKLVKDDFTNHNFCAVHKVISSWQSKVGLAEVDTNNNVIRTSYYEGPGNGHNEPRDIISDNAGNIYIACRSWGNAVDYDFVVLKFNVNGELQWEYRYNGSQNSFDTAEKIKLDSHGNIYVAGNVTLNAHGVQIYTVKLSPAGQLLWSDKFGRYDNATDSNYVNDFQIGSNDNIYLCGKSLNASTGKFDFLTLKYNDPTSVNNNGNIQVEDFSILPLYPNPFNPQTNLKFNLPKSSVMKISVYNAGGEKLAELANSIFPSGESNIVWNASAYSSGVYFISFETENLKVVKKAVLTK